MSSKQKLSGRVLSADLSSKEKEIECGVESEFVHSEEGSVPASASSSQLTLSLSSTLIRKLTEKAQSEGVSIQDFVSELLSEGLVLRAWEIVEKKGAMRGHINNSSSQHNNNYRNNKSSYRNNNSVKRMPDKNNSRHSYKNIMEDNANFLEYVRSQEKKDRF